MHKFASEYYITIASAIREYLYSDGVKVTKFRNDFKKAIQQAFYPAFEQGLADGGGEIPATGDDLDWINAKDAAEFGYVDMLFQHLKALKDAVKAGEETMDVYRGVPEQHAESYARTLDGIYSEGKIRGAKDQMLTFGGQKGEEGPCGDTGTCAKLMGKRHKASWWKAKGLIPGQPGNDNYDCGGWQCKHYLYNNKGEIFNV